MERCIYEIRCCCCGIEAALTWAAVVAHVDVVMRIAEEARLPGGCQFLAILYDDLLRRSLSDRASKKDPELKLEFELNSEIEVEWE